VQREDVEGLTPGSGEPPAKEQRKRGDFGGHKELPDVSGGVLVGAGGSTKEGDVHEHDEKCAERQTDGEQSGWAAEDFGGIGAGVHRGHLYRFNANFRAKWGHAGVRGGAGEDRLTG
jgi:hypothetical protein